MLELKGENQFRIRAFESAVDSLENLTVPFEEFLAHIKAGKVKGFGPAISEMTIELADGKTPEFIAELKKEFPFSLSELLALPGLGPKKFRTLYEQLKITSLEALQAACENGQVAALKGFGEKMQENLLDAIEALKSYRGQFLLKTADGAFQGLAEFLKAGGLVDRIEVVGSIRRRKEIVSDIDILATSKDPKALLKHFLEYPVTHDGVILNTGRASITLENGLPVDLHVVAEEHFESALLYFTGSDIHRNLLNYRGETLGLKLTDKGLSVNKELVPNLSEAETYQKFGLCFLPPEVREGEDEVEFAAQTEQFPELIKLSDIRGILHAHSTYSDGKNLLREMAVAVRDRGYEYLGISDHSRSAAYAGGLSIETVKKQHDEIDRLNEELKPFKIFKGIESDILRAGSLDYPEEVLETFDFVIASVHARFNLNREQMTERIVHALENPFTTILGHASGRLLLKREAYEFDIERVLETAAKNNVAVEINANPRRLDLDWRYHRQARGLGIKLPICQDAHSINDLDNLRYGVDIARKGCLTPADILNTKSAVEIEAFFKAKKR